MVPVPVVTPLIAAPSALVVRVYTRPVRGLRIVLRRSSHAPGLVVTLRARRGRVTLRGLRAATLYGLRARSCWNAPASRTSQRGTKCSRWSRTVRVSTLHTRELPRIPAIAGQPPIGRLPELGMNDLTAATNHPDVFWSDEHALGMTWVRIVVDWHIYQPTSDAPDYSSESWRVADAFMARAKAEGARILVSFGSVPAWARLHAPSEGLGSGARPAAYAAWVRLWLDRYPQTSAVDQHEANCCSLSEYVATRDLAGMLDASYPILRAAGVESIAGSWTEGGVSGARARQAIRFLGAYYKGRHPSFDSLGFHAYPSLSARRSGVEIASPPPTDSYLMTEFGRLQHDIDNAFPGRRMPWSITETGWSTPGGYQGDALSGAQQAAAAIWELREASRYTPRLERLLWFLDVDQSTNEATRNIYKSAFRYDDASAKPLFDAWRDYVTSTRPLEAP